MAVPNVFICFVVSRTQNIRKTGATTDNSANRLIGVQLRICHVERRSAGSDGAGITESDTHENHVRFDAPDQQCQ